MIIRLPRHPNYLSQDPESISRTFLEQFALVFNFQGVEVSIVPFTTMRHGFLTRGNMEDPEVAAEVLFSSIFVFK